jgi:O-antigen ligase
MTTLSARAAPLAWATGAGVAAALAAATVSTREPKYLLAVVAAMAVLPVLALLARGRALESAAIAGLALTIPFNLDLNLFYQPHVGGPGGLEIAAADVVVAALWLLILTGAAFGRARIRFQADGRLASAMLLYTAAGVLSLMNAEYPHFVLYEVFRLCKLITLALLVMHVAREQRVLRLLVFALSAGVAIEAGLAIAQFTMQSSLGLGIFGEQALVRQDIGWMVARPTGTIGHPNILAYYFEILLPLCAAMFLVETRPGWRMWYFGVSVLAGVGLLTTLSRAAWLALPPALLLVLVTLTWRAVWQLRSALAATIVLMVLAAGAVYAYPLVERRFLHDDQQSVDSRMPLNRAAWSIIEQHPLLGVGLNNYSEVNWKLDTTGYGRILRGKQVVHNLYLLVWAEVGTVGFAAFTWLFGTFFVRSAEVIGRLDRWHQGVVIGMCAGLIAHLIHGLADPGFKTTANISMLVFTYIGILGAVVATVRWR